MTETVLQDNSVALVLTEIDKHKCSVELMSNKDSPPSLLAMACTLAAIIRDHPDIMEYVAMLMEKDFKDEDEQPEWAHKTEGNA